jgi:predicted CxxxxCH...CXXCH cytochrome family protein
MRVCLVVVALLAACGGTYETGKPPDNGERHHPVGFAEPDQHGPALKLQAEDCRLCHGQDLAGGVGVEPSCDGCHQPLEQPTAWRTNCVFCHGGMQDQTGAPPRQIDGSTGGGSFPAHSAHVTSRIGLASDCTDCHVKATDVLSPGHVFDASPGRAEVDLGAGRSPQGVYAADMCTNMYCHGNGRGENGTIPRTAAVLDCTGCHPGLATGAAGWQAMSGQHALHLGTGTITCGECHRSTTTDGQAVTNAAVHVDGLRQVAFTAAGFTFDQDGGQTCTGTCHSHDHQGVVWQQANGNFHPDGWEAPEQHGPEMANQRMNCRSCHGDDLAGQGTAPSCDSCHQPTWRTDCVYCHGGGADQTGAPPRDVGAAVGTNAQSFVAHTRHVGTTLTVPLTCSECHTQPVDVLSTNHAFDASRGGVAEVSLAGGRSPDGAYGGAGACSNLYCHGDGQANGMIADGAGSLSCAGCHPGMASDPTDWQGMSGEHDRHLGTSVDATCGDCHAAVAAADGQALVSAAEHIDGAVSVDLAEAGITFDQGALTCTGACHTFNHAARSW